MALPMQPYLLQQWKIIWVFVFLALPLILGILKLRMKLDFFIHHRIAAMCASFMAH